MISRISWDMRAGVLVVLQKRKEKLYSLKIVGLTHEAAIAINSRESHGLQAPSSECREFRILFVWSSSRFPLTFQKHAGGVGGVLVACWWRVGGAAVARRWRVGGGSVAGRWRVGGGSVVRWWRVGGALVVHWWYVGYVQLPLGVNERS